MDIPSVDIEEFQVDDVSDDVQDESGGALKTGIIGSGQCGGKIAEAFLKLGYTKCISINTTTQDPNNVQEKLIMKVDNRPGGAGKDMGLASTSFEVHKEELYSMMGRVFGDVDHILVCAGLGAGQAVERFVG